MRRFFVPLELNEENVDAIFKYCMAHEDDDQADIYEASIYFQNIEQGTVKFSKSRLEENKKKLLYLIGQFQATHNPSPLSLYSTENLAMDYKGLFWSTDLFRTFAIPHLVRYFNWNSPIFKIGDTYYLHTKIKDMKPTISPTDPEFDKWWRVHKKEWE